MRVKTLLLIITILSYGSVSVFGQGGDAKKDVKKEDKKVKKTKLTKKQIDGLRVAESSVLVYSGFRGRKRLGEIRKSTVEIGKMEITNPDGTKSKAEYESRSLRGESMQKEKIRIDQKFPSAQYALIYNDDKIFGLFNNAVFQPRADAAASFKNRIWHGLDALIRYNENGSKVVLEKEEKVLGVDYYVVNLMDKENRKTTYYVSKKSYRVLIIEYESEGVNYRRKLYNHNYAQGTLVPYRSVLWANDKMVEEKKISTITYGQVVRENIFKGAAN